MTRRQLNRLGVGLAAAVVLTITSPLALPQAAAHVDPAIAVRLVEVKPALPPGVQMRVIDGERSHLALSNVTAVPAEVLDPDGRPFLLVSTGGVVGDASSRYLNVPTSVLDAAIPARPECCPEGPWLRLSGEAVWSWADPRLDPPLDAAALGSDGRGLSGLAANRPLATWRVDVRLAEQEMTAFGVLERRQLGRVRTSLGAVPSGIAATLIDARRPQLRLEVPAATTCEVLGDDGRPVLRLDPNGAFARADSPEYREHRAALGLGPEAASGWVPIDRDAAVTWADPRLGHTGQPPTDAPEGTTPLGRWRILLLVEGQPAELAGVHSWEAVRAPLASQRTPTVGVGAGSGGSAAYLTGGVLTVALVAAYLLARRKSATGTQQRRTEEE